MLLPYTSFGKKLLCAGKKSNSPTGTLILTSPAGHTYVTTPAAHCCSPPVHLPVAGMPAVHTHHRIAYSPERAAMMPKRRHTRTKTAPTG